MPEQRTFDVVPWPAELATVREQLQRRTADGDRDRGPRELMAPLGDERTIVMPIVRASLPPRGDRRQRFGADLRLRGYTIVGLAVDELVASRLPALADDYFPDAGDYRLAIVARDGERVVYESEPGAAAATAGGADFTTHFFQPRVGPLMIFARATAAGGPGDGAIAPVPPPPPPPVPDGAEPAASVNVIELRDGDGVRTFRSRMLQHPHGHWTLRMQHRAGSLEAAVAASRRRNLLLSGGVLALLGVAVALIAASARRSQALARQQVEFVAAVSHELRTPVAVIQSAAGNLADGVVGDPARVKRYGTTIQAEARRLGDTVERVLHLAGLEAGHGLAMHPVAIADVVHDALQQTAGDAARAGVHVELDVAPDLPPLLGDAPSLQAAVRNLVGNAVKYAGDDRWVGVRVAAAGTAAAPEVRIAVDDHGAGLDADERRRVFEPFYRGREAVANQIQGSGLGLSLVQRIARAHGGRIEVATERGRGSTFTLCLPAAEAGRGATATAVGTAGAADPAPSAS
jgi:signal transduction histidine kinase